MSEMLSTRELARRLGVTPHTVINNVHRGIIPVIIAGPKAWRFDWEVVSKTLQKEVKDNE